MPISKCFLTSRPVCKVRFLIPASIGKKNAHIYLVGNFNRLDINKNPMRRLADGSFSLSLNLAVGQDYQYRYLFEGMVWGNNTAAGYYEYCPYAETENSVVSDSVAVLLWLKARCTAYSVVCVYPQVEQIYRCILFIKSIYFSSFLLCL